MYRLVFVTLDFHFEYEPVFVNAPLPTRNANIWLNKISVVSFLSISFNCLKGRIFN